MLDIESITLSEYMPFWLELSVMVSFAIGFAVMQKRGRVPPALRKQQTADAARDLLCKSIEAQINLGDPKAAVALWRAAKAYTATPIATLRVVCQALLETEPDNLVSEVVEHIVLHPIQLGCQDTAAAVLGVVGRSGNTDMMYELFLAVQERAGLPSSSQMHEALVAGYAFAGKTEEVSNCLQKMRTNGPRITVRTYALAIKGLLRNGKLREVLEYAKEMRQTGLAVPPFAVTEIFRLACELETPMDVLELCEKMGMKPTTDAILMLLHYCTKYQDFALTRRVENYARAARAPLSLKAYDALLKLYTCAGDPYVMKLFEEVQRSPLPISEGLCVGLLTRCADAKFLLFADEVVKHVRSKLQMTITLYSALMKVYAYCGMYDKACDLYSNILEEGLEPDQIMYSCFMKFAVECDRISFLRELSQKVPSLDLQNSMSLIRAAMKDKNVASAFEVLERLKAVGLNPDVTAYNAILNVCAVAGDLENTQRILKEMEGNVTMDLTSYNTALKAYCTCNDANGARRVLSDMEDVGFIPNDVSYNCLINMSVSAGNLEDAWETIEQMLRKGIASDHYTVATMMKVARGANSAKDLTKALALLDRSGLDVCQDEVLLNSVLEACTRHRFNQRLENILQQYLQSDLRPQAHTYAALVRACGILRLMDRAWILWDEMVEKRGMEPTEIAMGCMLDALVNNGLVDEAVELFKKWKTKVPPNVVMYSTLLKGYANAHMASRAMDTFRAMREEGMPLCTKVYNSLIDAHARAGAMDDVADLLRMMQDDGCPPDSFTRSLIVKGHCTTGDLDKAFEAFHYASSQAENGDVVVFNNLLDGCVQHNRMTLADRLLEQMDDLQVIPTSFTLAIVVKMWGRRRHLDRAFEVVESWPKKYNFQCNGPVQTSLMSACLKNNAVQRALKVFEGLRALGNGVHTRAYGSLICGCARLGFVEDAIVLAKEAYGLDPKQPGRGMPAGQTLEPHVREQLIRAVVKHDLVRKVSDDLMKHLRAPAKVGKNDRSTRRDDEM